MLQHARAAAPAPTAPSSTAAVTGRRALLLSALATALAAAPRPRQASAAGATTPAEDVSSNALVQSLLAKSNAPGVREARQRERLEAYNDKIYGEGYFEVEIGQGAARARGISDETASAIQTWAQKREARLAQKRGG